MYKKIKVIREEIKKVVVQHRSADDLSKVKTAGFDKKDSRVAITSVAGKQKEPNRGPGTERHPSVPKAHRTAPTNESINERAESTRYHPTHALMQGKTEIKYGATIKDRNNQFHAVERIEPSKFGGAADRVITHSADDSGLHGSFHPKDLSATIVKRKLKEDIGMGAGAAGDPGAVRSPEANYAAQKARGVKTTKMLRRKKPK